MSTSGDDSGSAIAGVQDVGILLDETTSTEYRPALRRIEGNRGVFFAARTDHSDFNLFPCSWLRCKIRCRDSFVLGLLARTTSLRWILETFVPEELLLSDSPDEILVTVDALHRQVVQIVRTLYVLG